MGFESMILERLLLVVKIKDRRTEINSQS